MKKIFTLLLSLALIGLTLNGLMAQEAASDRQIRLIMKKNVKGVETSVDTTIILQPGQDPQEVIESLGMDKPSESASMMRIRITNEDGNNMEIDQGQELEFDVDVDEQPDGSMKVKIVRDGETRIIEGSTNSTWTTDEGEVLQVDVKGPEFGGEGEQIRVIRLDEGNARAEDVEVQVVGEGADQKVIINRNGEVKEVPLGQDSAWVGEGDGEGVKVFHFRTEDSESIKHIDMDHRVFMIDRGDLSEEDKTRLEEALELEDRDEMVSRLREILGEDDQVVDMKHTEVIQIEIKVKEPNKKDMDMLRDSGAFLNNSLQLDELSFYPNPNNGRFSLQFQADEEGAVNVTIRDLHAKVVYQEDQPQFQGIYQNDIDISGESPGVYFLSITVNDRSMTKKLVME